MQVFGEENTADLLGCSIVYNSYYSYNVCNGWFCEHNWNCASGRCCGNYCNDWCGEGLAWLWWTLSFIILILCIMSCIAAAKRRRRMQYLAAVHRNSNNHNVDAVIVTTQAQPGHATTTYTTYGQPGQQPVSYNQVPGGNPYYGNNQYQQP